ncbi:MAG TPA: adenylate/guanylate cyclase domain-containing protein [Ktedonobacterales bacterium]|jgi:class 3 adenylate cyclase|nr:adenylate/guanylate cyclase domain-containing protein [Ktedonobacterales bacterium]
MAQLPTGTVTFLFTDIEGSTQLLQRLGDNYARALGEHQALLRAAFAAHAGAEVDTQGDAFFVAFPTASGAVAAAIAATRALADHAWPEGVTLRVRMGLHSGARRSWWASTTSDWMCIAPRASPPLAMAGRFSSRRRPAI